MKYIKVLETINLKNLFDKDITLEVVQEDGEIVKEQATMGFKDFLIQRAADPKMSATMEMVEAQDRIKKAIDESDSYVALETSDWKLLLEVVKTPSYPYNPVFARSILPFMKAVSQATDSREE